MVKAQVENQVFDVELTGDTFVVNGKPISLDIIRIQDGYFHILLENCSYRAEIVEMDPARKTFTIKINGRKYPLILKDKFDLLLEKMGMNTTAGAKVNNVRAPMPGLIIDLKVRNGDSVKAGDALLILEAMKMENIIKAPGDATVKSVKVSKGDGVEKNQVLIEF